MKVILCTQCGNLSTTFKNKCDKCTSTNFEFYKNLEDPALRRKIKGVRGYKEHSHPYLSALLVIAVSMGAAVVFSGWRPTIAQAPTAQQAAMQTAATSSSITH